MRKLVCSAFMMTLLTSSAYASHHWVLVSRDFLLHYSSRIELEDYDTKAECLKGREEYIEENRKHPELKILQQLSYGCELKVDEEEK
jgi:hypothetical protein